MKNCVNHRLIPLVLVFFTVNFVTGEVKSFGQTINMNWSVSEFQPDIKQGGRANTIAVHPTNNDIIFVASESGGLFKSADRGITWRHVNSLPCFFTYSVVFAPSHPNILLVTTGDDFKTAGGGGVWRSTNGGQTWTQATVTLPASITGRLAGYEISIAPDSGAIYVGAAFGALMSSDNGASWTFQDVFGGGDRRVSSILALGGNLVLAGGPRGIRRSTDGGQTWTQPATTAGAVYDLHAFGRSPHSPLQAYVVNSGTQLFYTHDGGNNWTQINSAPSGGGGCGGISFIKAVPRSYLDETLTLRNGLELYYGNRCDLFLLKAPFHPLTGDPIYSGQWQRADIDHGDTRDVAFHSPTLINQPLPLLLGTDGGLHKTADFGATWRYVGGGRDGYNALQITEIKGQFISDIGRHDLYFGTQDNDVRASGDNGVTWPGQLCCEGFFIEAQRLVQSEADSKINTVVCAPCNNVISDPLYSVNTQWRNPPGAGGSNPMVVREPVRFQGVDESSSFSKGMAVTHDLGVSWSGFVSFNEERRDLPKLARPLTGVPNLPAVVYQAYRAPGWAPGNHEINRLMRIESRGAGLSYPSMNNFGGLGITPTMFAWYQVYAVNPGDHLHLMAPDVINQRVMETRDGGNNWTEAPGLTNLVTDSGRLLFNKGIFPNLTAISFSHQLPRGLLAGTSEGAIYQSSDLGANWSRIPGSEKVTFVTSFYWRTLNDVIVSTYGRGLWRLRNLPVIPIVDFGKWCFGPCNISLLRPEEWRRSILIYNGRVTGARIEGDVLQEVFVTTDSSVVFGAESGQSAPAIKVTETNSEVGFSGAPPLPKPPKEGWIIKGLVFDKDNRLAGLIFGDQPMTLAPPESDKDIKGPTEPPSAGKPYIHIVAGRNHGAPTASPGEVIRVTGANFPRDAVLEIAVDGQSSHDQIRTDGQGAFIVQIPAPPEMGMHSVIITTGGGKKTVLDGSMFLVTHLDENKKDKKDQ